MKLKIRKIEKDRWVAEALFPAANEGLLVATIDRKEREERGQIPYWYEIEFEGNGFSDFEYTMADAKATIEQKMFEIIAEWAGE